jgi:hypothetical protein
MERFAVEHARVAKELVVHLPELALARRRFRRASREPRAGVLPPQRKVPEDQPESAAELLEIPDEEGEGAGAVETLEVGVFDDRDERGSLTSNVIGLIDGTDERRTA